MKFTNGNLCRKLHGIYEVWKVELNKILDAMIGMDVESREPAGIKLESCGLSLVEEVCSQFGNHSRRLKRPVRKSLVDFEQYATFNFIDLFLNSIHVC